MHDNVWQFCRFVGEFPIAAILNPSLKSRFISKFSKFVEYKFGHKKIKVIQEIQIKKNTFFYKNNKKP